MKFAEIARLFGVRARLAAGAGVLAALVGVGALIVSSSATAQGQGATKRVIIVLKNQEQSLAPTRALEPRRLAAFAGLQSKLTSQLSSSGARNVQRYSIVNAISATVSPSEESQLKSNSAVQEVIPDQLIHLGPAPIAAASSRRLRGHFSGGSSSQQVCAPNGKVQLNPEALETIKADSDVPGARTARSLGFTGAGVTVGFIADGLDINNQDFQRNGKSIFTDYEDFSGYGTGSQTAGGEAFLDASAIAAQGTHTYNVQNYSALPLSHPCNIRIEGVAPGVNLVGLDVFGPGGLAFNSSFLEAINYAVTVDHVNVLNQSLGENGYPVDEGTLDIDDEADEQAVAAGTTVVNATGDAAPTNSIDSPAEDPAVISAGATTTFRSYLQTNLTPFPGINGWINNNIAGFSSSGFAQNARTLDVVAPGDSNWALCSIDETQYSDCVSLAGNPTPVQLTGGTSQASPLTSGVAALVIQAYRKTHGGASPSPAVVKEIITSTADDIGAPAEQQGSGLIDAYRAVLAAESYGHSANASDGQSDTLLKSSNQLNAIAAPGTRESLTDTVTNSSDRTQRVDLSTRALSSYQSIDRTTVQLSDASSPKFTDATGRTNNYARLTFTVPRGTNRLDTSIAYQTPGDGQAYPVNITLVDPSGKLAANSSPQGSSGSSDVQVTNPAAGRWTAYIYDVEASDFGINGSVLFQAGVAHYTSFGAVSPSTLTLAPGQSGTVTFKDSTPSSPVDAAGAIVFSADHWTTTTVPVTLRSLIPAGPTSFTGTVTNENGRAGVTGQTFYYQLQLPSGDPELNASVKLADNPNYPFNVWLVDPQGEALAFAANEVPSSSSTGYTNELAAQAHVLDPSAGTWTVIIDFTPTVSGTTLAEPFTANFDENRIPASATPALPNSASSTLSSPATYQVKIKNTGPSVEEYFLDAREPSSTDLTLTPLTSSTLTLPATFSSNFPLYVLPTHTTSIAEQVTAAGPQPVEFDSSTFAGEQADPDIGSTQGTVANAAFSANEIVPGGWAIYPVEVGPFGPNPGPTESVTASFNAVTNAFDPTVSSPTGDLWLASTNPSELGSLAPVVAQPGQTVSIPVTITPSGPSGTVDSGTLYVDDADLYQFQAPFPDGNEVAAIPYSYTVK